MSKTIFDYDSSDDEKIDKTSVKSINNILINSNILYNAGNAILHNNGVFLKYKQQKTEADYKTVGSSTLINKFLTKKEYTEEDKNSGSLNRLLDKSLNKNPNNDNIKAITDVWKLYKQIEEKLPERGLINIENFKCFKVLQKYFDKNILTSSKDKKAIQEIGEVFNILQKQNKNVHITDTIKFFKDIKSILDKEIIQNFLSLIDKYSNVSLLNDEITQIITNTENSIDEQYINTVFKITEVCKTEAHTVINAQKLYKQIEEKLPEGGLINIENFKCFKVLNSCKNWSNVSTKEQINIADAFNFPKEEVQTFLNSISGIENTDVIIDNLIDLTTKSSGILNDKISNYIVSEKQTLNFDFALDILCDKQLYDLASKLSDFDSLVNGKIKELPFFNTSVNEETNAQEFLASSLTYQKFLKTITKFTLLRTHGNEVDTNVQYGKAMHRDKSYSKTISTKSTLSTGLKRTEEVSALGNYSNISKMLLKAQETLKLTDQELVKTFQDILKGQNLYNNKHKTAADAIKVLYDITYLLFSCEVNRNPEALISNAIFLELVEQGKYTINHMTDHLPMAMSGAIEIGRFYHNHDKSKRVNDYAKTNKAPDNTDEFIIKESVLFQKWLGLEKIAGEPSLKIIDKNKELDKKKKKEKNKEGKEKVQQELDKNKEQIQEIADQCKKLFSEVNEDELQKLNELIQRWYGISINLKAGGAKPDDFLPHDHQPIDSTKTVNKYCSVVVKKYKNYQDNTSQIIDIQFQPLEYKTCAEIDTGVRSKLKWIIEHKDPASRKRSYYEAFPEELHYSNVFEKRLKLSEYEVINTYYMSYCLAISESAIIERLVNGEFLFSHEEFNQYNKSNVSQNYGYVRSVLRTTKLLPECSNNKKTLQLDKEFDEWCKVEWKNLDQQAKEKGSLQNDKKFQIIQNKHGGDCAIYSTRDALNTINHEIGKIPDINIQNLRKEICYKTSQFFPLYNLYLDLERKHNESHDELLQKISNTDWIVVRNYYKNIFGDQNLLIFKQVISVNIDKSLKAEGIILESFSNLSILRAKLNSFQNWDSIDSEIIKSIFLRYSTLDINVKAILEDHQLNITSNQNEYYEYASKQKVWLSNSEISAYLLTLGFILESGDPLEQGTYVTYTNLNNEKLYFYNDGNRNFSGTSWMAATLKGSEEYIEEKDIDYINSYFGKYTLAALDNILSLRLNDLHLKDIKVLKGIFIDQGYNNISNLISQILISKEQTVLVPLNLFNKHAIGIIFEKYQNNTIQVKYLDSLNKSMPRELKQLIVDNLGNKVNFQQITTEQQKYANCGAEVIENFIFYLTGKRISQEKAIELHSKLVENELLGIKSSGIHFLFEDASDNFHYAEDCQKQDHNDYTYKAEFHNFDYDNLQLEIAGDAFSFH